MLFNSYIFILLFFPIVCAGYYLLIKIQKQNWLNCFLLVMSLTFYLYAGKECLILLLGNVLVNYLFYRGLKNYKDNSTKRKWILGISIGANLLLLFYFKYVNFFIDNINLIFEKEYAILNIIQPLGISFIVFQQIAFLVDASRGEIEECSFVEYALFITYFPHISSGPIILGKDILPDLKRNKVVEWNNISVGIYMFVMGLAKKVLIADTLAKAVDWGYTNIAEINTTSALFISVAYSLQIYFDFSGYSDMAIGISRILQLDLPVNFNSPYKANTILEFWERWHMTLTRFLTKYLYIPLGGNRKGKARMYLNTLIVFLCSGIWHGASWTFVLWGAMHGCFMIVTKCFKDVFNKIPNWINRCITLVFVNFAWVLFRAGSFGTLRKMIETVVKCEWGPLNENISSVFIGLGIVNREFGSIPSWSWTFGSIILLGWIVLKSKNTEERARELKLTVWSCLYVSLVACLCVLSFSGVSSFIYSMF